MLAAVEDLGLSTSGGVADQQGHTDETEGKDCVGEDGARRESLDERGDEDRTNLWDAQQVSWVE